MDRVHVVEAASMTSLDELMFWISCLFVTQQLKREEPQREEQQ